jgi:hypothetical protein
VVTGFIQEAIGTFQIDYDSPDMVSLASQMVSEVQTCK